MNIISLWFMDLLTFDSVQGCDGGVEDDVRQDGGTGQVSAHDL